MQFAMISRVLVEAARIEGSTQALATRLHAPHSTLTLWMTGRAQTPLRVFLAALEFVMQDEQGRASQPPAAEPKPLDPLAIALGPLKARCARCDCSDFLAPAAADIRYGSTVVCANCGERGKYGILLAELAKDVVQQSRAVDARGARRVRASQDRIERSRQQIDQSKALYRPPDEPRGDD